MSESRDDLVRRKFLGEPLEREEISDLAQDPEGQKRLASLEDLTARLDAEGVQIRARELQSALGEQNAPGEQQSQAALEHLMATRTPKPRAWHLAVWAAGLAAALLLWLGTRPFDSQGGAPAGQGEIQSGVDVLLGDGVFHGFAPAGEQPQVAEFRFEHIDFPDLELGFQIVIRGIPGSPGEGYYLETERLEAPHWTPTPAQLKEMPGSIFWTARAFDEDGTFRGEGPLVKASLLRD